MDCSERKLYLMNNRKRMLFGWIFYIVLFLVLSQYDLQISLYMTAHPVLPYFGKAISVLPGIWIGAYCSACLAETFLKIKKYLMYLVSLILCGITVFEFSYYSGISFLSAGCILAVIILYALTLLASKKSHVVSAEGKEACWKGILLLVSITVVINILKAVFARPRFYSLSDPISQFTPWYEIHGLNFTDDLHKSFPSGHTATASVILWITLLPSLFPSLKKHQKLLWIIALAWIVCTCIGRISDGAHYLSDVMAAFGISLALYQRIAGIHLKNRQTGKSV